MEVIPVIDIMGGVVVRARMGERDQYRPIVSPLSSSSDPIDVARALLAIHPFGKLYVADLDAIQSHGDNRSALMRLRTEFPQLTLWVDSGIADITAATRWLGSGLGHLVLGSESQSNGALVQRFAADTRVILSLDFRGDSFQGTPAILAEADGWPQDVIVMTLARVGSGAGPDMERLATIQTAAPGRRICAAGGVRDPADLAALKAAGIAGALIASCLHDGRVTGLDLAEL